MSLLSDFVLKHLIEILEAEFIEHAPELQQKFVDELKYFVDEISLWIGDKIKNSKE